MPSLTTIATWTQTDYQGVTATLITSMTPAQVALMKRPDWLLPAAVAGFTAAQIPSISLAWSSMSAIWLNALSPSAFAAIPATGVGKFGSAACAGLDAVHVQALTVAQAATLYYPESLNLAAVAVLAPAQVAAISTSWKWMTAAWLNAMTPSAFAAIPTKGIGQLAAAYVAGLDVAHIQAFTPTQLNALTLSSLSNASVAALTTSQLAGMTAAKWSGFSAAQINAIPLDKFATLSGTALYALTSATCGGLDLTHVQALSPTQFAALRYPESLSLAAVAVLTPAQISAVTQSFGYMNAAWLNALAPAALKAMTTKGIGQLTTATIAGLNEAHVQALTATQLDAIGISSLSTASVAAFTTTQITGMAAATWGKFSAAQLNALPVAALAAIPAAGVAKFSSAACAGLDVAHVQALTVAQMATIYYAEKLSLAAVAALSPAQIAAISTSFYWMTAAWLNATTPATFAAITATGIGQLAGAEIAGLDVAHTRALTAAQLNALSLDSLSTASIGALLPSQLASITQNFYFRTPAWLNALSPEAFAAILPADITEMKGTTIAALDAVHIGAMTAAQVAALDYSERTKLTAAQMGWFSASGIAGFTTAQLDDLTPTQLAGLTAVQTAGLTATQIASLTTTQLAALSASAVSGFGPTQLAALGTNLCVLSPAAIAAMPVSMFSQLSLMQLSSLQGDQVAALTSQQLASLSATQVNYLTPGQLDVLGSRVQSLSASALAGLSNVNLMYVYASLTSAQRAALTPAQTAAVQTAGTAVTTLLGALTDASVRTQIEAVINSGESLFSYNSLVQVLSGVDAAIGSTGLSQAQMNDLKALTTAVGQTLGTNSYLAKILGNVVNGDLSNAWWTGGGATSVALGNLAVGSSAGQMSKLISKWFLGGDLPTWSGSSSYTPYDAPLFAAGGPRTTEVSQGSVGDCYLLAAMIDVADDYSSVLESMFTDNGNGTWGVRFYAPNDDPLYVTVNNVLPSSGLGDATSGALWVSLIEKAYVEWEVHYKAEMNQYDAIDGGDYRSMQALMGRNSTYYTSTKYTLDAWSTTVKSTVINALNSGQEVMLGSGGAYYDLDNGKQDLVGSHMFAVLGFDAAKDQFILQNPWGSDGGSTWNGVFDLSITELWANNNDFIVTNEGSPVGALDAKFNYNAVNQLVQAMSTGDSGAAATTTLASASALDRNQITLVAAV